MPTILITLPYKLSPGRATEFSMWMSGVRRDQGEDVGVTVDPSVYVVRPGDPSEDAAVFAREVDAQAFADTFENVGDVECCLIIDAETTVKMVAERENEE